MLLFLGGVKTTTYAYTEEEKAQAKAWLSANGYSPDANGAAQAYADYMAGKFGKIEGLPDPEGYISPEEKAQQEAERNKSEREKAESEQKSDQKKKKESKKENGSSDPKQGEQESNPGSTTPAGTPSTEETGAVSETDKKSDSYQNTDGKQAASETSEGSTEDIDVDEDKKSDSQIDPRVQEAIDSLPSLIPEKEVADAETQDGQSGTDEEEVFLSPEDMERIQLLASIAEETEAYEKSGKEYGITQNDRKMAVILACVGAVLVIAGSITAVIVSKKQNKRK